MRQWTVDAFASEPFRGNPACVVEPFDAWPADAWMQALAQENNQAETAFLLRDPADPARFGLRWFTPSMEVPLCGHATLASAHVLLAELGLETTRLAFDTRRSGRLSVVRAGEGYAMDFPADPPGRLAGTPDGLSAALGVAPQEVWAGRYMVAVLESEAQVRALAPDLAAIARIGVEAAEGRGNLAVCAAAAEAASGYDVIDRFFAPGSGVAEDPATGSLHCMLSPLYADKLGRSKVRFHQAFPGRGGDLACEALGDRVRLEGAAVTTMEARLRL